MPPSEALQKIRSWVAPHFLCLLVLVILPVPALVYAEKADYLISLVRHGDRSPRCLGNQADLWPIGAGQLTAFGANQMQQLGQEIRRRYFRDDFPRQWNFKLSSHYSKGINRTVQSAMALLQGVYPSLNLPTGLKGNIQIPSVYASPLKNDLLFSPQHICAGYVQYIQELEESFEWQEVQKKYESYLKKWRRLAGVNSGLYPLASFMDRVSIHANYDLPLPEGINMGDALKMKELLDWILVQLGQHHSIAQLVATPLIESFIQEFQQVMSCAQSNYKIGGDHCQKWTLYMGSDINLIAIMELLGIANGQSVDYGSHLEVQMNWRDHEPEIAVFFDHQRQALPDCKAPCLLDSWLALLERIVPENWERLCNLHSGPTLSGEAGLAHPVPDSKKTF